MALAVDEDPVSQTALLYGPIAASVDRVRLEAPGLASTITVRTLAVPDFNVRAYIVHLERAVPGAVRVTALRRGRAVATQTASVATQTASLAGR